MKQRAPKAKGFEIFKFVLVGWLVFSAMAPTEGLAAIDAPALKPLDTRVDLQPFPWNERASHAVATQLPDRRGLSEEDRTAVETILLEAAGDGFASMVAVGETIRNRTRLFRASVPSVCLKPKQFSGWNDSARASAFLAEHQRFYGRAWLAWKLSAWTCFISGATDYHTKNIHPYWADAYSPVAQVGSHIFYIRQARRTRVAV